MALKIKKAKVRYRLYQVLEAVKKWEAGKLTRKEASHACDSFYLDLIDQSSLFIHGADGKGNSYGQHKAMELLTTCFQAVCDQEEEILKEEAERAEKEANHQE